MSEVWGLMPKSQDDPETIEEAITRIVGEHNDNNTAHAGTGQSLDVHRQSEVLDHLALSIVADKIASGQLSIDKMSYERFFTQLDFSLFNDTANFTNSFGGPLYGEISNTGTTNTWYGGYFGGDQQYNLLGDPTKNPTFRIRCVISNETYQEAYFGIGDFLGDSALGFKLDNGVAKGVWWDTDTTEHLITLSGVDVSIPHNYSVIVDNGVAVRWLVDGAVVHTLSWPANIIFTGGNVGISAYTRHTTAGENGVLIFYQALFEQDFI